MIIILLLVVKSRKHQFYLFFYFMYLFKTKWFVIKKPNKILVNYFFNLQKMNRWTNIVKNEVGRKNNLAGA